MNLTHYSYSNVYPAIGVWNQRHPAVPASTGDEALFQCTKPSGVPRGPSHLQFPWLIRATMRSPLRSAAQVEGTQGFLPQPEKDLERLSSTRLEARFPSHGSGAMTRSPSPLAWRPDFLAPHERLTDLAVVPREKPHTGAAAREQPRDSPVIERWGPSSPAWPREQSRGLSPNASGGLHYDGYSISSKGFLPIVVDILVIWVKFTHSSPS